MIIKILKIILNKSVKIFLVILIITLTYSQLNCCPFTLPLILKILTAVSEDMKKRDESVNRIILQLVFTAIVAYYEYPYDYKLEDVTSKESIDKDEINKDIKIDEGNFNESSQSSQNDIEKNNVNSNN
jgi:hypothetical protein